MVTSQSTFHLDSDQAVQADVRNAARTLSEAIQARCLGHLVSASGDLDAPRVTRVGHPGDG